MISDMAIALSVLVAYLVGSINFAVMVGRMQGVDVREEGSGNPGMSNVLRTMGKGPAAIVFVGDTFKGVIGAAMGWFGAGFAGVIGPGDGVSHWAFLAGLAAVAGHCYPIFHGFRGGKGVATGLGVLIFTVPLVALIDLAVWGAITALTRIAAIGSLVVVLATVPLAMWQGVEGLALLWMAVTIVLVVWRHKDNIKRLVKGREQKVTT